MYDECEFRPGDRAVRVDRSLKGVPIGAIVEIVAGPVHSRDTGPVYSARVVGEKQVRSMYACFLRPVDVLSAALMRDGINGQDNLIAQRVLADLQRIEVKPQPSVKVQLRREGRPDRKKIHALPVGWKYGLRPGDGKDFNEIVFLRPAGWSPLG